MVRHRHSQTLRLRDSDWKSLGRSRIQPGSVACAANLVEGKHYEIDLTNANAEQLRSALAPFIAKARSASSARAAAPAAKAPGRKRASAGSSAETQAIREWAQANGYPVGDRGRIAAEIREAYAAAK